MLRHGEMASGVGVEPTSATDGGAGDRSKVRRAMAILIGLRVAVLVLVVINWPAWPSAARRFHEIASTPGIPYRDFQVEYPIGELGLARIVGASTEDAARIALALVAFGADLAAFAGIRYGWGALAARRYLILGTPLLVFIYRRSDLVAVALAAAGLALAERRRERSGGAALGVATLVKLWPVVLLPVMLIRRRLQGIWSFAVVLAVGVAGWVALGGLGGIRQVVSLRGSTGWEVESSVGAVVWAITGEHRFEQGANRTGMLTSWAGAVMALILVGGLMAVWWRARSRATEPAGAPALVAVALLLVTSPVLSPGYVAWLLPWGAIAAKRERKWLLLTAIPCVLTAVLVAKWNLQFPPGKAWSQTLLILRNASLAAIPLTWLMVPLQSPASGLRPG